MLKRQSINYFPCQNRHKYEPSVGAVRFKYTMEHKIDIKRAYDAASAGDGFRIYIDRLWPRGLSHETFHYDLWDKEIAPSTELREWFHTSPDSLWPEFVSRYKAELNANPAFRAMLQTIADKPKVTLLYSSHDRVHNNAVVVEELLAGDGWQSVSPS